MLFLVIGYVFLSQCGNQRENTPQHYFSLSQDDLFWNHPHHCWGRDCIKYRLCDLSLNMVVKPAVTLHDDWWISLPVSVGIRVSEWVYSEGRGSFRRLALNFMNTKSKVTFQKRFYKNSFSLKYMLEKICNLMEKICKPYILVPTKSAYLPQIFAWPPLDKTRKDS